VIRRSHRPRQPARVDDDAAVRSAILNVFLESRQRNGRDALDAALKNSVDLHRVIVQSSGATPFELATAQPDRRGIYFIPGQADDRATDTSVDRRALHEMFVRLASLRSAFLSVLKAGGRTQKMDHVYCPECDFAALGIDLSEVSFEGAVLPRSRWSGARLDRASFRNAVIEQANFTAARLEGADFSNDEFNMNRQEYISARALRNINRVARPELYLYGHRRADVRLRKLQRQFPKLSLGHAARRWPGEGAACAPTSPQAITLTVVGQREA
jgi:uncharacterized protein YjbI with pentapeptide repeats